MHGLYIVYITVQRSGGGILRVSKDGGFKIKEFGLENCMSEES